MTLRSPSPWAFLSSAVGLNHLLPCRPAVGAASSVLVASLFLPGLAAVRHACRQCAQGCRIRFTFAANLAQWIATRRWRSPPSASAWRSAPSPAGRVSACAAPVEDVLTKPGAPRARGFVLAIVVGLVRGRRRWSSPASSIFPRRSCCRPPCSGAAALLGGLMFGVRHGADRRLRHAHAGVGGRRQPPLGRGVRLCSVLWLCHHPAASRARRAPP